MIPRLVNAAGWVTATTFVVLSVGPSCVSGDWLIVNTVRASLVGYTAALVASERRRASWISVARVCWIWAAILFVIHVAVAFHFRHQWSHASAFESVRLASGDGRGIFVSYAFTLLWIMDAGWWWFSPATYLNRSVWVSRGVHAFMGFIIFNGTVIFADGPSRWVGIVVTVGLVMRQIFKWQRGTDID